MLDFNHSKSRELGDILTDSGELGEMTYRIFHLKIISLQNLYFTKKKFN